MGVGYDSFDGWGVYVAPRRDGSEGVVLAQAEAGEKARTGLGWSSRWTMDGVVPGRPRTTRGIHAGNPVHQMQPAEETGDISCALNISATTILREKLSEYREGEGRPRGGGRCAARQPSRNVERMSASRCAARGDLPRSICRTPEIQFVVLAETFAGCSAAFARVAELAARCQRETALGHLLSRKKDG